MKGIYTKKQFLIYEVKEKKFKYLEIFFTPNEPCKYVSDFLIPSF